jgi:hypothetical protein
LAIAGENREDELAAHVVAGVQHDSVQRAGVPSPGVQVVLHDGEEFAGIATQAGEVEHDQGRSRTKSSNPSSGSHLVMP